MSSILGHGLAGALCVKGLKPGTGPGREGWLVALAVTLALIPDLDVVIYALARPEGMIPHRGFSHSLSFALLSSSLATWLTAGYFRMARKKLFGILFLAALTQPALDILMGCGPEVPLFAPFSYRGFLFPVKAVPTAYYATTTRGLLSLFTHPWTLICFLLEALIFIPLILLFQRGRRVSWKALVSISALAECLTLIIYAQR